MRTAALSTLAALLTACEGSTDTGPVRYNFAVVDGANQVSTAGAAVLAKPVTSQLTRDPQGKFATRVFDFFAPAIAYAQGLILSGDPVPGRLVCGREALPGEPRVVPLCAFTLADGKAPNVVQPGTKAGVFNMLFTAQVPSELPVTDSTTVTVEPAPFDPDRTVGAGLASQTSNTGDDPPVGFPIPDTTVTDGYRNLIPFRIEGDSLMTVKGTVAGTAEARRLFFLRYWERGMLLPEEAAAYDRTGVLRVLDTKDVPIANLRYWITDGLYLSWVVKGLNLTP